MKIKHEPPLIIAPHPIVPLNPHPPSPPSPHHRGRGSSFLGLSSYCHGYRPSLPVLTPFSPSPVSLTALFQLAPSPQPMRKNPMRKFANHFHPSKKNPFLTLASPSSYHPSYFPNFSSKCLMRIHLQIHLLPHQLTLSHSPLSSFHFDFCTPHSHKTTPAKSGVPP